MPKKIVEAKVIGQHVLNNSTKLIEVYAPELVNKINRSLRTGTGRTCRSGAVCKRAGI